MQEKLKEYLDLMEKQLVLQLEFCSVDIQNVVERKGSFEEFKAAFDKYQATIQSLNVLKHIRGTNE